MASLPFSSLPSTCCIFSGCFPEVFSWVNFHIIKVTFETPLACLGNRMICTDSEVHGKTLKAYDSEIEIKMINQTRVRR